MTAARMSSADLVHLKGLGSSLCFSMKARISASRLAGGGVHAALQLLARQFGEPAFDLIDPRRRSRRKVDMPVRPPCQPGFHCRRLVGGVIVHDDVDVQPLGDTAVDLFQEVEKLPGPVAPVALADDEAGSDIEGCEQ